MRLIYEISPFPTHQGLIPAISHRRLERELAYWRRREELSYQDRISRSYYELLRDHLDQFILEYALLDSFTNFKAKNIPYPFVEKRELKPRARIPDVEYEDQNAFLVIFTEDSIPSVEKKYIRFFDDNKTTKTNLLQSKTLSLADGFDRNSKNLESATFTPFLKALLPVDYALLIQRDPASTRDRYVLSHYHVRIDWPIADAAEDLARSLRYISKDLYEKGEKYAEDIQKKFFEYYALPAMVGGRRTAAVVASQYLRRLGCISTVYVGSSESRSVIRISQNFISKSILMKFNKMEAGQIAETARITPISFHKNYVIAQDDKDDVCIFQARYGRTEHARAPEDGKLRELKPDPYWMTVSGQYILPCPGNLKAPPISLNLIYA